MDKKNIVIIAKLIPIISAILFFVLILGPFNAVWVKRVAGVIVIPVFLGFGFFFIGRKYAKEDMAVKILGIFDILSTVLIIAFYTLVVFYAAL